MRLRTVLLAGAAVIVGLGVAAVVVVSTMDFNQYKPMLAERVKAATGRDIAIQGDVKLGLSLTPTLAVDGVTFANASWGSRPEMARVKRLEVQVQLLPLISREIHVDRIVLVEPDILLETNAQGQGNWVFDGGAAPAGPSPSTPSAPGSSGPGLLPQVASVAITDARIAYRDARTRRSHTLAVKALTLRSEGGAAPLGIDFDGTVDGKPLKVNGNVGPIAALFSPGTSYPVNLEAKAADATVKIEGAIRQPMAGKGYAVTVSATGSEVGRLGDLAGIPVPSLGPFTLSLKASDSNPNGGPAISDLKLDLGKPELVKLAVSGAVGDVLAQRGIALTVAASGAEIANLGALAGRPLPAIGPFSAQMKIGSSGVNGAPSVSDLKVDLGKPETVKVAVTGAVRDVLAQRGVALTVTASGAEVARLGDLAGTPIPALGPFSARMAVGDGGPNGTPSISDLKAELGRPETLKLDLAGAIRDVLGRRGIALTVAAASPDIGAVAKGLGHDVPSLGALKLNAKVTDPAPGRYALGDLALTLGQTDLAGAASVAVTGARPVITASLTANQIDAVALMAPAAAVAPPRPGVPAPSPAPAPVRSNKVFPSDPLPFDLLAKADADIRLTAKTVRLDPTPLTNVALTATVRNGELTVKPLTASVAGGTVSVDLTANAGTKAVATRVEAKGIELGPLLKATRTTDIINGGRTDAVIDVRGAGGSVAAVMASLNGTSSVAVGRGEIASSYTDILGTGVVGFFARLQESRGARETLNCIVARHDIRNGVASARVFLFDTNKVSVPGGGAVNLGTEAIDMKLEPKAGRTASVDFNVPGIRVGGTLSRPVFTPDAADLLKGGVGAAVGAIVLGPAGVLAPLAGAGSVAGDACGTAVAQATGRPVPAAQPAPEAGQPPAQGQAPAQPPQQQQQRQQRPSSPLDDATRTIDRLFRR